ncbi:3-oxoacyl-[acyl-carrier-protein] reductase [Deferribacter autotrophicus]|uniref:3-oxoacyl-[acyl-carrier-protein] reductase n=1 Tax=Deferribacter autotrophicus TaxID=500465 RepID=A0A5A8F541_9BACT|nr:3-oxoacyl-[acyl-carrier-protein] reductase [Deferribacter autotrophicus]KAA0258800.1 3-oxoacyl-[acyl-carrier-protein] reductase [Deferribacter autotrophicus]
MSFKDKVVLVTGGSRGIGKAIAIKFGELGCKVAINYNQNKDKALEVADYINKNCDGICKIYQCNVTKEEDVKKMVSEIEKELGSVDILVNNAGITKDNIILRLKEQDFDDVFDVNIKGAFFCIKAVSRGMMKKRYGKIINISSVVGFTGNIGQSNYVVTKSGLIGLTKSVALELSSRGIRVNAVAPGFIETEMTESLPDDVKKVMLEKIPLGYFGKPEDVANAVVFLASEEADYITGTTIHVNGGMYLP